MTNKTSTKRALLTSALAVLLCLSMLIGTTFAWFTDSVTSSGNKIVAGTLKIDLEVLSKDNTTWTSVKDSKDAIFSYDLWEPGYTEVKVLKVQNEGSLALKWKATLVSNATLTDLANVIDVYVKPGVTAYPTDRALADWENVGTLAEFINTIETTTVGTLEANAEATLGIAFKMQEAAGNEYQGMNLGGEFDICILATQYTKESDSFDNTYDENATFGTYIELNAGDDLLAALASAKADQPVTIKLLGDVEWPTEGHHGENDITPASSIVIDGNGNTITATGAGVTPLGDQTAPMTLKNVTIVDNSVSYNEGAWELTYLELGGSSLTCNKVTFADEIQPGTNATFTNCTFESNEASVYAVWVEDGSATFTNCTFTGYRGLKVHEDYGTEVSSVVVKGCTFSDITKKPGIALGTLNADTTVSITDSAFINCQAGDQGKYIYETDTDVTTIKFTEVNNTVFAKATDSNSLKDAIDAGETNIVLAAGIYEFPAIPAGTTIVGQDGVIFEDTLSGTLDNVTLKNIHIKSGNAQRWAYSKGDLLFENCTFEATSVYAIHYDGLNNANIVYKDCTIIGWAAIGSGANYITFDGCQIYGNGSYGLLRLYSPATIKNCVFDVADVNTTDVFQDGIHAVDCEIKVSNNTNVNGTMSDIYNISGTGVITEE